MALSSANSNYPAHLAFLAKQEETDPIALQKF